MKSAQLIIMAAMMSWNISFAGELPQRSDGSGTITGGNQFAKASGDTIDLLGPSGSGAPYLGDFTAGWNGWTTVDATQPTTHHWNVSTYNQAVPGNYAAWCGDITIASCNDSLDAIGGYGNSWHDLLAYRAAVANPGISALVTVTATLQHDTEPGYDYTRLSVKTEGNVGFTDIQSWDYQGVVAVDLSITFLPGEYVDGTDVYVLWRVQSDGGWSDTDCLWPTAGACQIDDITVTIAQSGESDIVSFTDFQTLPLSFGDWFVEITHGVGNFGQLWRGLRDVDPCASNYSQQVAFIDDGLIVPGTGGTECINWCYGPGGYIVTTTGGLVGSSAGGRIHSQLRSPIMAWPEGAGAGVIFSFDVYRHEDLDANSPQIFYQWGIRAADTDGSAGEVQDIEDMPFQDRNFVYYGGPDYLRVINNVSDLIQPGRDEVQILLSVYQLGWSTGFRGHDGFPAPYFDNVSLKIFPFEGPSMSARELDLAQDNFPEVDALPTANGAVADAASLATMSVRFDMAHNISLITHLRNDPGDSIVVDIVTQRPGAILLPPTMHYQIDANPVFAGARSAAFSASGAVTGIPAVKNGVPSLTKWAFDLPDTGFLFPGDVLHYYIRAGDDLASDIKFSILPKDITGFGDFDSGPLAYNTRFTMHALPSVRSTATTDVYTQPEMLFWNDAGNRGHEPAWYSALGQLGFEASQDYDIYYTNAPSSGVGNGLGGRTSGLALEDYNTMLYSAGSLGINTLSNGDFQFDAGDDISAVLNWLSAGNKNMYLTGDAVANDMGNNAGAAGLNFIENVIGVDLTTHDIRRFIENQAAPLVLKIAGNSVVTQIDSWIAYGGCTKLNTFDGVTARAGSEKLAEFAEPNGNGGAYSYSAMTKNIFLATNTIISQPYDFGFITIDPNEAGGGSYAGRVQVLSDILTHFGVSGAGEPTPVGNVTPLKFTTSNFPNPFNPTTKISYTIKAAGYLSLKVYNVRGQLVKTLIDGHVEADSFVMWDGTNNQGANVSSGVYFYEARMGNDVKVNKLALVK